MLQSRSPLFMKEPHSYLTRRSTSDMASIKSTSSSQQQLAGNQSSPAPLAAGSELINSKFNELAKKILEELSHSQYSKEFFHALDCIIKEPAGKSLVASRRTSVASIKQSHSQLNGASSDRKRVIRRRPKASDNSQDSSTSELALSNNNNNQRFISKHQSTNRPQLVSSLSLTNSQKSIIPVISAADNGNGASVGVGPKRSATQASASQVQQGVHRLTRSATSAGEMLSKLKTNLNRLTTSGAQHHQQVAPASARAQVGPIKTDVSKPKITTTAQQNAASQMKSMKLMNANSFEEQDDTVSSDGQDEDEDEEDEEEEEITFDEDMELDDAPREQHLSHAKNQILQSLPVTTNNHQPSMQNLKSRHNPVARSHTITSTKGVAAHLERLAQERSGGGHNNHKNGGSARIAKDPRSIVFNKRDMGALYKPNMNYSTSVLGNHRLSDDDEIIIIPTQSPSIMSTSPDGDNVDEASERFSISRTKSFWEKLSKGNNNHRSLPNEEPTDSIVSALHNNNNNNNPSSTNNNNSTSGNNNINNNRLSTASATGAHNVYEKPMAVRGVNPNFLDRMDSTGGSNSNYNGSSSGDENFTSYTNPNPTIRHLQEMSRQNRFRQTRGERSSAYYSCCCC